LKQAKRLGRWFLRCAKVTGLVSLILPGLIHSEMRIVVSYIDPSASYAWTSVEAVCAVRVPSGDFDLDGRVSIADVLKALRAVVYAEPVPGDALLRADMNLNGFLDIGDVTLILRRCVGL